eukprot:TRINITY_DN12972_c0_g1_i1.p1 TRINITY_DN12972_c0_g1~~TRINITY_DN12972_c0_g1_i1.p1  ORF type:complete len:671 (-),score=141.79 TRINITY_DN12972_c0_g1_i1:266-2278(-)
MSTEIGAEVDLNVADDLAQPKDPASSQESGSTKKKLKKRGNSSASLGKKGTKKKSPTEKLVDEEQVQPTHEQDGSSPNEDDQDDQDASLPTDADQDVSSPTDVDQDASSPIEAEQDASPLGEAGEIDVSLEASEQEVSLPADVVKEGEQEVAIEEEPLALEPTKQLSTTKMAPAKQVRSPEEAKEARRTARNKSRRKMSGVEVPESPLGTNPGGDGKDPPAMKKGVFASKKAMKAQLEKNLTKATYNVSMYYWDTGVCRTVATNNVFENLTLGVISFNALWISIDTEYNTASVLNDAHPVFIIAENFFCLYFLTEWSFRFGAFKNKLNGFRDAWFVFDSFMVGLMVFETWIMFFMVMAQGSSSSEGGDTGVVKLLRLLRLSRMARMARLLRSSPELLVLIKGIAAAVRSVVSSVALLTIVLYIFGILFKSLASEEVLLRTEYFSTIPRAIHALVVYGVLGDSLTNIALHLANEDWHPYAMVVSFYLFVLIATLTIMNMLIGITCEVITATAEVELEGIAIAYMGETLKEIVDTSETHTAEIENIAGVMEPQTVITKDDFLCILEKKDTALLLEESQVDVVHLVDIIDTIFTAAGEERHLEFNELLLVLLDHRTTKVASIKDIVDLRKDFGLEFDIGTNQFKKIISVEEEHEMDLQSGLGALEGLLSDFIG